MSVSIESMKLAPPPVAGDDVILRASLAPAPPREEHWWWLQEVRQGAPQLRVLGTASGGTGTFEIQVETSRGELEASTRLFRDALSAAIAARPTRYAADQQARDAEITAEKDRQRVALEADQATIDRVMEE